ncbi:hypothetical protein GWK47_046152 [Chionoecetes opilio]|uniref:Uncharacterized protein n=1 Tax=Chionoecetes opilio TaxID=41210 RepID=A0A8J5CWI2_CHIOP|nr:hypothetical protein GWK47_046152 [Chionoecetes opilio]
MEPLSGFWESPEPLKGWHRGLAPKRGAWGAGPPPTALIQDPPRRDLTGGDKGHISSQKPHPRQRPAGQRTRAFSWNVYLNDILQLIPEARPTDDAPLPFPVKTDCRTGCGAQSALDNIPSRIRKKVSLAPEKTQFCLSPAGRKPKPCLHRIRLEQILPLQRPTSSLGWSLSGNALSPVSQGVAKNSAWRLSLFGHPPPSRCQGVGVFVKAGTSPKGNSPLAGFPCPPSYGPH